MVKKDETLTHTLFQEFLPLELSKAQRRKLEIIESAIALFSAKGIEKVTYKDLATHADISRALVQHYFPQWDELVLITMRYIRGRFQKLAVDHLTKESTPKAQLKAYVNSTFLWVETYPMDARVWLLFYYYCSFRQDYLDMNTELVNQGHARISALLEAGNQTGDFRVRNVPEAAKQIQGVITGTLLAALTEKSSDGIDARHLTLNLCCAIVEGFEK